MNLKSIKTPRLRALHKTCLIRGDHRPKNLGSVFDFLVGNCKKTPFRQGVCLEIKATNIRNGPVLYLRKALLPIQIKIDTSDRSKIINSKNSASEVIIDVV